MIELRDEGWLIHAPDLYNPADAADLFARLLADIPWKQEMIRGGPVPRLNAWFSDAGLHYAYSGLSHQGTGWPDWLVPIKERVEAVAEARFNSLLLNRYRDGQDSIGFHTDAEPELGLNPAVATLSFGAERDFVLRHRKSKETLTYRLGSGSLLVMGGASQHHWVHGIPKTGAEVGERVSLTFRLLLTKAAKSWPDDLGQ
jgi:alkylated DNA repair dioxygenase AlkB